MLTREAWEESSESAPGVSLRFRKPLGGTFVADVGNPVFDNRLFGVCGVSQSCSFFQVMCRGVSGLLQLLLTDGEDVRVGLIQAFVLLRKISLSFL